MRSANEDKIECYADERDILSSDVGLNYQYSIITLLINRKTHESTDDLYGKIGRCKPDDKMCQRDGHV